MPVKLEKFSGAGSTPKRRKFWDKIAEAIMLCQKIPGKNVSVDVHEGYGSVINVNPQRQGQGGGCDCCIVNSVSITATVTSICSCEGISGCPCDGGPFTIVANLSGSVSSPCGVLGITVEGDDGDVTDYECSCPSGDPPYVHASIQLAISPDGMGGCLFQLAGLVAIHHCGSLTIRNMGATFDSDSLSCTAVFGSHSYSFDFTNGDGDFTTVNVSFTIG